MKRIVTLILAFVLTLSLTACFRTATPVPEDNGAELVEIIPDSAPEDAAAPDAQSDEADAQAPPEAQPTEPQTEMSDTQAPTETPEPQTAPEPELDEHGTYDSKEEVALFIHTYGHLPDNYISKKEAQALGWSGGSLEAYAPGKCIGGSRFGNYEGLLPEADGRRYTECDIDTLGARGRGAKRIVFSNDGLIYYTGDHYETFELLYGEA